MAVNGAGNHQSCASGQAHDRRRGSGQAGRAALGRLRGAGTRMAAHRQPSAKVTTERVQDRYNLSVPTVVLRAFGLPTVPQNQRVSLSGNIS